jgi:hypothetical protein
MCSKRQLTVCIILVLALIGLNASDANAQAWNGTITGNVVNPNGTPANSPWTKDTVIITVYCMNSTGGAGTSIAQVYNGSESGGINFSVPFSTANCSPTSCAVVVSFQVAAGGTEQLCTNGGKGLTTVMLSGGVSGGTYSFGTVHLTKTTCDCGNFGKGPPESKGTQCGSCQEPQCVYVSPRRGLFRCRCR